MNASIQQDYFRRMAEVESSGMIDQLEWQGLNLWSFFRMELLLKVLQGEDVSRYDPDFRMESKRSLGRWKLKRYLKILETQLRASLDCGDLKSEELWLFSESDDYYRDEFQDGWYNRHVDPHVEAFSQAGIPVAKVRLFTNKDIRHAHPGQALWADQYERWTEYVWTGRQLMDFELTTALKQVASKLDVSLSRILAHAARVKLLIPLFEFVLQKVKPRGIGVVNYHTPNVQALLVAARRAGIGTYDIQHGKQGTYNFSYSGWRHVTKKGDSCLPDGFWNWNTVSAESIAGGDSPNGLKAAVGGNLWLLKCLRDEVGKLSEDEVALLEQAKAASRSLLFCAQPLKDFVIPPFVIEYAHTHPETLIGVRLHPRQKLEDSPEIQALAELPNVEVSCSTSVFLYEAVKAFTHVVTRWSTVALEGLVFAKKVILVDAYGAESFSEYVQSGAMQVALDGNQWVQALDASFNEETPLEQITDQLNHDELKAGLEFLLNRSVSSGIWNRHLTTA